MIEDVAIVHAVVLPVELRLHSIQRRIGDIAALVQHGHQIAVSHHLDTFSFDRTRVYTFQRGPVSRRPHDARAQHAGKRDVSRIVSAAR